MAGKKMLIMGALLMVMSLMVQAPAITQAAETKIGIMNVQKVLAKSNAGKRIRAKVDAKMKAFREEFEADKEALIALQQEIEKKSSIWSEEIKAEKLRNLKKKERELKAKSDDANFEVRQLNNKELEPVMKTLETVVRDYGNKHGYTVILDELRSGVVFLDTSIIVTDQIVEELNKAM